MKGHLAPGEAAILAVFGALWGLMEITLGTALKSARLPFSGAILACLAAVIALTGRSFVHRRGAILMMGGVAALLKIFSVGTVIAGPFFAILIEALLADLTVSLLGVTRPGCILAGMAMVTYTVLHPLITQGLFLGGRIYEVYWATARQVGQWLHLEVAHLALFIVLYLGVHATAGGLAGWLAYQVSWSARRELEDLERSE
ncbi:MAG TPA: hypothetical protein PLG50_09530 [bacterium]|nr:hypothetical protein [bacterium]HQG45889.1 hypothetical protein [bacterium]HQI47973.1 hypothetical protein [bacterium]HQJ65626.1 hypothetical protein [bacterium]